MRWGMRSQRAWMWRFPYCRTQECKACLPRPLWSPTLAHLRIFYLLSLTEAAIGPRASIITMVNIELCPISLQIHSQLNRGAFMCVVQASFIILILNFTNAENREGGTSGWNARKEAQRRRRRRRQKWGREQGRKKRKETQRRQQNASLCLLAVELLFEMKIQSVWGITVDWQAHGSQAVICTPVIWSMVITAVCVCAQKGVCASSIMKWWVAIQTNAQCGQSKKKFFFLLTTSSSPLPASIRRETTQNLIFFSFPIKLFILSSHWVTSFSPSLPSSSIHSPLHSFLFPSSLPTGQKNCRHAPLVLRGSNFRFVSNFRLMSVFWLVV